jgi:hydroxymethylpyrimidine pyrophosphatase-like HAD family hydrolase
LNELKKTFVIDIDDTLLLYFDSELPPEERGGKERYKYAMANDEEIKILNRLYRQGHTIILMSGRGWDQYDITVQQLKDFKIKYHTLILGKLCGIWVDRDFKTSLKECI